MSITKEEVTKQWKIRNPDRVKEIAKDWYEHNKEHSIQKATEWRNNNREKSRIHRDRYNNTIVVCDCNFPYPRGNLVQHKKSKIHLKRMISIETNAQ
jgi:hypothetical protein